MIAAALEIGELLLDQKEEWRGRFYVWQVIEDQKINYQDARGKIYSEPAEHHSNGD